MPLDFHEAYRALMEPLRASQPLSKRHNATLALIVRSNMDHFEPLLSECLRNEPSFDLPWFKWDALNDPRKVSAIFYANPEIAEAMTRIVQDDPAWGVSLDDMQEIGTALAEEYAVKPWVGWKKHIAEVAQRFGGAAMMIIRSALIPTAEMFRVQKFELLQSKAKEPEQVQPSKSDAPASGTYPRNSKWTGPSGP